MKYVEFLRVEGGRVLVPPEEVIRIEEHDRAAGGGHGVYLSLRHAGVVRVDHRLADVVRRLGATVERL